VFQNFLHSIDRLTALYSFSESLSFEFLTGWLNTEAELEEQLLSTFDRDSKQGFTSLGCHKADIKIKAGKVAAVLGAQVFLTSIEEGALATQWKAQDMPPKMFHVEHGRVNHHKIWDRIYEWWWYRKQSNRLWSFQY